MANSDTLTQLKESVTWWANEINNSYPIHRQDESPNYSDADLFNEALDINYIIDQEGQCIGGRLLLEYGGPTIEIDTSNSLVTGQWGLDQATIPVYCEGLDACIQQSWYNMTRNQQANNYIHYTPTHTNHATTSLNM